MTDQQYFIQRICNVDNRFSQTPTYLYSAVSMLEKKQLQRNINLVGTRGTQTVKPDGISYELQDGHRVLEGIKGTPKYWQTAKYEMLAKLDNFGAFQLFFTLSCADTRWIQNFAPMFIDRGYELMYSIEQDVDLNWFIRIQGRDENDRNWRDIEKLIENLGDSKHEILRGNVVNATRFFQHRVKQFLSKIVLHKDNPMNVDIYSYRVEFQQRGAGHIHGTLWIQLKNLEKMVRNSSGRLVKESDASRAARPFQGISVAFEKLRTNKDLTEYELNALVNFIDEFTTVSLHQNSVGKDVVKIASEVNVHNHTKTCNKYNNACRFNYPRFPTDKTIIAKPLRGKN